MILIIVGLVLILVGVILWVVFGLLVEWTEESQWKDSRGLDSEPIDLLKSGAYTEPDYIHGEHSEH